MSTRNAKANEPIARQFQIGFPFGLGLLLRGLKFSVAGIL